MSDQAPAPQQDTAVAQAAADVPAAVKAAEGVVADVEANKLPSPEEQAAAETAVTHIYNDVTPVIKEAKAGYKTTEFWLTVVISLLTLLGTFPLPPKFEAVVAGGATAAYAISRGLAKAGVANVTPDQTP